MVPLLASRLEGGGQGGCWTYTVPVKSDRQAAGIGPGDRGRCGERPRGKRGKPRPDWVGDNSNTQFALLGLWAAGRHGFDPDEALESIDGHFRSTQHRDGRWGYRRERRVPDAMSCAGLMGLAIAAARPGLAERQTARARGAALAADPAFQAALQAVAQTPARSTEIPTSIICGRSSGSAWPWGCARSTASTGTRGARICSTAADRRRLAPRALGGATRTRVCAALSAEGQPRLRARSRAAPARRVALATVIAGQAEAGAGIEDALPGPRPLGRSASAPSRRETVVVTGASEQAFPGSRSSSR